MQKTKVSNNIDKNIARFGEIFSECSDIKMQEMCIGSYGNIKCHLSYIEVAISNTTLRDTAIGKVLAFLEKQNVVEMKKQLDGNGMGIADITWYEFVEDAALGLLTGDAILFVDGYDKAIKIADEGYPGMGIQEPDSEKVVRGSKEGFADSVKVNTSLLRKRIRSTELCVKEKKLGVRSHTLVNLVYMKDLVRRPLLEEIERRLEQYEIDGVLDSGIIEQLSEEKWYSPFPQFATTQRPDKAATAILEGRIVLFSDNSPTALILPTDFNSFLQTSDDYYNRFEIASFARILRYIAVFFAMTLPGLYIAVTNFHTQILPTTLLLAFQEARFGVAFPAALEVILMEIAFEMLREAGVRLPGTMGNTIGIVGGLIIGQAAVEANLVSPIIVIVVAFTALCSFAIPNEEFAFAFRLLKFFFIALCAWEGYFGFLIGIMMVLIHLSKLKSFGLNYLTPFVGPEQFEGDGKKDAIVRFPLRLLRKRPIYAREEEKIKLKKR